LTLAPDLELEATLEEWRRACAAYRSALRAPFEGRVANDDEHKAGLKRKLARVLELERDVARLRRLVDGWMA